MKQDIMEKYKDYHPVLRLVQNNRKGEVWEMKVPSFPGFAGFECAANSREECYEFLDYMLSDKSNKP